MAKMCGMRRNQNVVFRVIGAPIIALIGEPLTAVANVGMRWYEFLEKYGVKLRPEHGVYARNPRNKVAADGRDLTARAELDEPIFEFIQKFRQSRSQYTVKLLFKNGRGFMTGPMANLRNRKWGHGSIVVEGTRYVSAGFSSRRNPNLYRKPSYTAAHSRGTRPPFIPYRTRMQSLIDKNCASTSSKSLTATGQRQVSGVNGKKKMGASPAQVVTRRSAMLGISPPVKSEPMDEILVLEMNESKPTVMEKREPSASDTEDEDQFEEEYKIIIDSSAEEAQDENVEEAVELEVIEENEVDLEVIEENEVDLEVIEEEEVELEVIEEDEVDVKVEENEVKQKKIEDVKSKAQLVLQQRFNNSFLRGIRNEISKLHRMDQWKLNKEIAPLACEILEEMFK